MDIKEYNRERARRWRKNNLNRARELSRATHARHKEKINSKARERYRENPKKYLTKNKIWCATHKDQRRQSQRKSARWRNQQYKESVIRHYGNDVSKCVLCDEERLPALSIDHINGGGGKERRQTGRLGPRFYKWLIDNNFPEGYRTLCMNCQFIEKDKMHKANLL